MSLSLKSNLKHWPYFLIGVPLLYLLHISTEYYSVFSIANLITPVSGWFIGVSFMLFFLISLIWPSLLKYAPVVFCLEAFFFFFGSFYDFLRLHIPFIARYKYLIPLLIGGIIAISLIIRKNKGHNQKLFLYLNTLFIILVAIDLVQSVAVNSTNGRSKFWFTPKYDPVFAQAICDSCQKPDIYFILLDEYAGESSLKKFWNFDNSELDSFLRKNDFYYANRSISNYNSTPFSVGSTLNMDYHTKDFFKLIDVSQFCEGVRTIENNAVCNLLKENGYSIINQSIFRIPGSDAGPDPFFFSTATKVIMAQTFWGRMKSDIGWHWGFLRNTQADNEKERITELPRNRASRQRTINTYNDLLRISEQPAPHPVFVYTHLLLPHGPYFFDSTGHFTPEDTWYRPPHRMEAYLAQLKYTNSVIRNLVTHLKNEGTRPRIIIIQSDHGYRLLPADEESFEFNNLLAVYFPDRDYAQLYDSISSVNTFRVLFRKYFKVTVPLLKDSTIYIHR